MWGTQGNPFEMYFHILEHECDLHEMPGVVNREEVYQESREDRVPGNIGTWEQLHTGNLYSTEL